MMNNLKDTAVSIKAAENMSPEQLQGKVITGVLYKENKPEYVAEYQKIIDDAQGGV
jgi:2-oxoglutarate ferredoxin oxidoreductase subunit beta